MFINPIKLAIKISQHSHHADLWINFVHASDFKCAREKSAEGGMALLGVPLNTSYANLPAFPCTWVFLQPEGPRRSGTTPAVSHPIREVTYSLHLEYGRPIERLTRPEGDFPSDMGTWVASDHVDSLNQTFHHGKTPSDAQMPPSLGDSRGTPSFSRHY